MKIRRFSGKDMRDALKQVKDELGGNAVIMSNKKTPQGVELVAAIDPMEQNDPIGPRGEARDPSPAVSTQTQQPSQTTLREVIGDADSDSLQALLKRTNQPGSQPSDQQLNQSVQQPMHQASNQPSSQLNNQFGDQFANQPANQANSRAMSQASNRLSNQHTRAESEFSEINIQPDNHYRHSMPPRADENMVRSPAFSEESISPLIDSELHVTPPPSVLEPEQMVSIRSELESIKNVLKYQISELSEERRRRNNPVQHFLHEQLIAMGLSEKVAEQLVNFLPHSIGEVEGWNYLLNLLSNRIGTGSNEILVNGGVVALVGPTGSGKTTTLAKLAAKYAQKYGPDQVAIITIDTYRIAAYEQLATYGKIIGCSVGRAQSTQELSQLLYQLRNKSLVLIDTAGFSQRDGRLVEQLKQFEGIGTKKVNLYLTLPAGCQYSVLNETAKTYNAADLKGCIFTKLDECYSLGEALSTAIENDLPLSYVTDGQRVPEDIKLANASNLALVAARLYKKYGSGSKAANEKPTVGSL